MEVESAERLQEEQKSRQAKSNKGKGVKGKNLAKGKKGKPALEAASGSANGNSECSKQTQMPLEGTLETPDKTNTPAHQDEDSESETEVIRPRKPRRKLVVPAPEEASVCKWNFRAPKPNPNASGRNFRDSR